MERYHIAELFKSNWSLLSYKGDEHTNGIYFDHQHGYLVERTYAVRIEHTEPAPPVFYIPGMNDSDDEVHIHFPYYNMVKKPNKYFFLFPGSELKPCSLASMFECEVLSTIEMEIEGLIDLLKVVPKKRERERTWMTIHCSQNKVSIMLIQKKNEAYVIVKLIEKESKFRKGCDIMYISVNANHLFHALNLFSLSGSVLISKSHDRIIFTSGASIPKVEAVISLPKEQIQRDIENCSYS